MRGWDEVEISQALLDALPDGIVAVDAKGTIRLANSELAKLSGYTIQELLGRSVETLIPPRYHAVHAGHRAGYRAAGHPTRTMGSRLKIVLRAKDGEEIPVDIALSPLETNAETLVVGAVRDARARVAYEDELSRVREELGRLAILEDRERIGRELHDGVIQSLFGVGMNLQAISLVGGQPDVSDRIDKAVIEIDNAIRDLRNYIFGLRPGLLADRHLDQALRSLAQDTTEDSEMTVVADLDPRLAARLAPIAGDVVQLVREALSNVSRHAGSGTCRVTLAEEAGWAVLEIADDGRGFDSGVARAGGQGLPNLRERASALGGSMELVSAPGEGTTVRIRLPL